MSNEYNDWKSDRAQDAWDDIILIAELYESDCNELDVYNKVRTILENGLWI